MKHHRYEIDGLDPLDAKILRALATDARRSITELAREIGLSAPSVSEHFRRLEEAGVIRGYTANVNPKALGLPFAAYIRIRPMPGQLKKVAKILNDLDAVVECDRITGEDCFIAKAHVRTIEDLEKLIDQILPYGMTNTSIIQLNSRQRIG